MVVDTEQACVTVVAVRLSDDVDGGEGLHDDGIRGGVDVLHEVADHVALHPPRERLRRGHIPQ